MSPTDTGWQEAQEVWAHLIVDLRLVPEAPIVDIGAGASMMVDALLAHGYTNLTAVYTSTAALSQTRQRVGAAVDLVVADVCDYVTDVPVALWHDRAVFQVLDDADRQRYRRNLHASLAADGHAIIAADDPQRLADELDLRLERSEVRERVSLAVLAR